MSFDPDSEQTKDLLSALLLGTLADKAREIAGARFVNPGLPRDEDFERLLRQIANVLVDYFEMQNNRDKAGVHQS